MPPVDDREAWAVPAEPEEVEECTAFLITIIEPGLVENPNRVRALTACVAMQNYTRAELLLAMKQLPITNAYGGGFRLDLLDEIVRKSRNVRRIVADPVDGKPRLLNERQMFEACQEYPEYFRPEDFGITSYDVNGRPYYRYARRSGPHFHDPHPMLEETTVPDRTGDGGGLFALCNLINQIG